MLCKRILQKPDRSPGWVVIQEALNLVCRDWEALRAADPEVGLGEQSRQEGDAVPAPLFFIVNWPLSVGVAFVSGIR